MVSTPKSNRILKLLDATFPVPSQNLACDEVLLEWCEETNGAAVLRFWESPEVFVVIGYSNKVSAEVNVENCAADSVPILRRCSGGGTVLQGPGCLNYALILRSDGNPQLATLTDTNRYIMERNRTALQRIIADRGEVKFDGCTDLVLDGRKFSGNSQRRKRSYLLFHGTFLLDFDLGRIERLLRFPSKQPTYRNSRAHSEFLVNLNVTAAEVKQALAAAWHGAGELSSASRSEDRSQELPQDRIAKLAREKYETAAWNLKL